MLDVVGYNPCIECCFNVFLEIVVPEDYYQLLLQYYLLLLLLLLLDFTCLFFCFFPRRKYTIPKQGQTDLPHPLTALRQLDTGYSTLQLSKVLGWFP